MFSLPINFTGVVDTDLLILNKIDNPISLIDLYCTHEYMHTLLNSEEALEILSDKYNLHIVHSFQELIEDYLNYVPCCAFSDKNCRRIKW
jgi:hypothetical protein